MFSLEELAPVPDVPGPATTVHDRAHHLLQTLDLIGKARSRDGFGLATDQESRHRPDIEKRYGAGLAVVKRHVEQNGEDYWANAKWQFAYATGYITLKHSGLVSESVYKEMAQEDFANFVGDHFTGLHAEKKRRKLRELLKPMAEQSR